LAVEETKKRKLELRDELRKELATKEDILLAKQELKGQMEVVEQKIENVRQEIIGALVVIMNKESLEFLSRIVFGVFR
jgi:predicted nuclease with TOPRIM domain